MNLYKRMCIKGIDEENVKRMELDMNILYLVIIFNHSFLP